MSLLSKVIAYLRIYYKFQKPKPGWLVQTTNPTSTTIRERKKSHFYSEQLKKRLCAPRRGGNACPGDCS